MTEQFHEMLAFILENEVGLTKGKARSTASHFVDIGEFLTAKEGDFTDIKSITGRRVINLTTDEIQRMLEYKNLGYLSPKDTVAENFLAAMSRDFTKRQLAMLRSLKLDSLNPNPFLIKILNLRTPKEVVQINVYMAATRSIVTSMGFFVERLLLASSETVDKSPRGSGWDLLKTKVNGSKHWIQVKSGPNDMDKDQIVYWAAKIEEKISEGEKAYIGITYGKRTNETVTFGLMKQLLPDWEMKTLVGRELWDFISDDPNYHSKLLETLRRSAHQVLNVRSITEELDACVDRIKNEFVEKYGERDRGVSSYLKEIF